MTGERQEAAVTAVKTGPPRAAIPDTIRSDDRSDRRVRADRQSVCLAPQVESHLVIKSECHDEIIFVVALVAKIVIQPNSVEQTTSTV